MGKRKGQEVMKGRGEENKEMVVCKDRGVGGGGGGGGGGDKGGRGGGRGGREWKKGKGREGGEEGKKRHTLRRRCPSLE